MSGRKPRKDELDLWSKVADRVTPMPKQMSMPDLLATPAPKPTNGTTPRQSLTMPGISGGKTPLRHDLAPSITQSLRDQPVQMDQKAFRQLKKGKMRPDGRIDLHGMTADRAHVALSRFVLSSHKSGKRLLLVITGKGKHRDEGGPIPVRFGVLRHQVPEWLRLPPLGSLVMQVTEAHISHGGGGAYYVYLRRAK